MADSLNFDIYELKLNNIRWNSVLLNLSISTMNNSILVVKLSGFLNLLDVLWSSGGDGRIIVFKTNHNEKVDPALLHRDCLDVHVHMPCYLWFILKTLAFNYHGIKQHSLFPDIENLLMHTKPTAAEIVKQLRKDEDANNVLKGLFEFLKASEAKRVAIQQLEGKGIVIIIQSIDTVA
ncbi:hypothetical protein Patl1_36476 [Pistacia atlantica]|nr:hypothetical protein Patl1_36476 [Pistacia atlantica]